MQRYRRPRSTCVLSFHCEARTVTGPGNTEIHHLQSQTQDPPAAAQCAGLRGRHLLVTMGNVEEGMLSLGLQG